MKLLYQIHQTGDKVLVKVDSISIKGRLIVFYMGVYGYLLAKPVGEFFCITVLLRTIYNSKLIVYNTGLNINQYDYI